MDTKKRTMHDVEDTFEDEGEEKPKKSRFGYIGSLVSAVGTAAKEHVASAILGDDWGEALVERMEERKSEDGDEEDDDKKKDGDDDDEKKDDKKQAEEEKEKPKKRGLFRRGKK